MSTSSQPPDSTTITAAAPPPRSSPNPLEPAPPTTLQPTAPPTTTSDAAAADFVTIPSHSKWFRWDAVDECEVRMMPEFFDGKSVSKNPRVYRYYRNGIVKMYRAKPMRKITFSEVRRRLVGDVGAIRRVFDFLETWGLVNYQVSGKQGTGRVEEKEKGATGAGVGQGSEEGEAGSAVGAKKVCSFCKSPCSIACFVSDKFSLILCARCYVRRSSGASFNSSDFRRVEVLEQSKTDWSDKEILKLLEAITHYGDNWRRVAEYVGGRSEKECVARFLKLPFGEQFVEPIDGEEGNAAYVQESSSKGMRITPLADASNPILAQAAFLSALAGVDVAEAAARAAVTAVHDVNRGKELAPPASPNSTLHGSVEAQAQAESLLKREEDDLEKAVAHIAEVQMQEIQDKITRFEEMELKQEKEWEQLNQMKYQLFVDQLALSFHTAAGAKSAEIAAQEISRPE
ncbi:SWI/SNF complex subunit SWI3B-like protein [Drosera capensis]